MKTESKIVSNGMLRDLEQFCDLSRAVIITDANVRRLYEQDFPIKRIVEVGVGEANKTLATVEHLYRMFAELDLDRRSWVVGIGGGIVCDLTGFAAATYLRGLSFGFVPTTLLAQVDAAYGGKNGVNFESYKNQIGVFQHPRFVLCDPHFLSTLSADELRNGLAEIIKHAAIADEAYFAYLTDHLDQLLALQEDIVQETVRTSINIKMGIVEADVYEQEQRKLLNFGHTIGHALEATKGISHGEAVALGMRVAARMSRKLGLLSLVDEKRLDDLLQRAGFTRQLDEIPHGLLPAIFRDKKRRQGKVDFVLLERLGRAMIRQIDLAELEAMLHDLR